MYQEKEKSKVFKTLKKSKKSMALLASLLLLVFATVGGTVAFLMDKTNEKVNQFTPSEITTTVVEELNGQTKSNVKIQNTGDTEAYIRAAVVVTWKDKDGNVYGKAPIEGTDYKIDWYEEGDDDSESNWKKGVDGFYYWTKPVNGSRESDVSESSTYTGTLIKSCTVSESTPVDDYFLNVEIIGSSIQSKPINAVVSAWSTGVKGTVSEGSTTLDIIQ